MFALKQEFRSIFRKSPFYLKASEKKKDIERYSDKYQLSQQDVSDSWKPGTINIPKILIPEKVVVIILKFGEQCGFTKQ